MFRWQTWILTVVAAVTVPLYFRILWVLILYRRKYRFSSHFYTITTSQGFIDVIGFICYYSSVNMREIDALKPFYWSLNWTVFVQWSYIQSYLFEYARILGVAMISIERCCTVSYPHSRFNQWLVALPSWYLFAFQITMPIMLVANMFFIRMYFDAESTMNVVISQYDLEIHYMKTVLVLLIATIICAVAYGILINTIRKSTVNLRCKDIRVNIQAIGLLLALVITLIHFCAQYTFNKLGMTSTLYIARSFTPLWIGMLTFINPWMILLMNRDLRRATFGARTSEENSVHPVVFRQQKSRSMKMQNSLSKILSINLHCNTTLRQQCY